MRAFPRVLFDEGHSESWTIRRETAEAMNPAHPDDNSYARAAELLRRLGHQVTSGGLESLGEQDVLVIAHPSQQRWERTTGQGSPVFSPEELDAIESFVAGGGGLVVLAEEEQDKYGNNLADLLARFGIGVTHTTVRDPGNSHRGVATWVLGTPAGGGLLAGVGTACFYRSGVLTAGDDATVLFTTSATRRPGGRAAGRRRRARQGQGRGVRRLRPVRRRLHRRLRPPHAVEQRRDLGGQGARPRPRLRLAGRREGRVVRRPQGRRGGAAPAAGQGRLRPRRQAGRRRAGRPRLPAGRRALGVLPP
ncbi:hypothetical protein [Nonomuraea dietziae]|uniref:hypothetical protein n=1 Tax=Nonomuraea dietziae TaxID=65515 RepID=UPI0031CFE176